MFVEKSLQMIRKHWRNFFKTIKNEAIFLARSVLYLYTISLLLVLFFFLSLKLTKAIAHIVTIWRAFVRDDRVPLSLMCRLDVNRINQIWLTQISCKNRPLRYASCSLLVQPFLFFAMSFFRLFFSFHTSCFIISLLFFLKSRNNFWIFQHLWSVLHFAEKKKDKSKKRHTTQAKSRGRHKLWRDRLACHFALFLKCFNQTLFFRPRSRSKFVSLSLSDPCDCRFLLLSNCSRSLYALINLVWLIEY